MNSEASILSRREALTTVAVGVGSLALLTRAGAVEAQSQPARTDASSGSAPITRGYTPCVVPNGWTLPFTAVDGVKVFHLVAEEVRHEFAPGLQANCWGYNGGVHGPLIEAVEGDRVRIFVTNKLPAPTTVHWHGLIVPSGMDGVGGLSQRAIQTGETFQYEFTLKQHGTFMYHSHHDEMTQMAMGLTGMFVVHPSEVPAEQRVDRDVVLLLHEWRIDVGTDRPDPGEMSDFNVLTLNARVFPGTAPVVAKVGDRVRLRFGNLSAMDHHPMHLHGFEFAVTAENGFDVPSQNQVRGGTVLVPVGTTKDVTLVADNAGDWALHCHMTHHVMNQMGHNLPNTLGMADVDDKKIRKLLPAYMTMGQDGMAEMGEMAMKMPPNSIPMVGGAGPKDYITMGGMFTIVKVRNELPGGYDADVGWYQDQPGETATVASADVLARNQIDPNAGPRAPKS